MATQRLNTWATERAAQIQGQAPSSVASRQISTREEPNFLDYMEEQDSMRGAAEQISTRDEPTFADAMASQKSYDPVAAERNRQYEDQYTTRGEQGARNLERLEQQERWAAARTLDEPQLAMSIAPEKQYYTPYTSMQPERVRQEADQLYESRLAKLDLPELQKEAGDISTQSEANSASMMKIINKYKHTEEDGEIVIQEQISPSDEIALNLLMADQKTQINAYEQLKPRIAESDKLREISGARYDIATTKLNMFNLEYNRPENVELRKLEAKYEELKPFLNPEPNKQILAAVGIIGRHVPFVGKTESYQNVKDYFEMPAGSRLSMTNLVLLSVPLGYKFTEADEKLQEYSVMSDKYQQQHSTAVSINVRDIKPLSIKELAIDAASMSGKINKKNIGEWESSSNILQSYNRLQTEQSIYQPLGEDIIRKTQSYQEKEFAWKYAKTTAAVALFMYSSPEAAVLKLAGATRTGRTVAYGIKLGKSIAAYNAVEPIAREGSELIMRAKTVYQTGDFDYMYKERDIISYQTAVKAEQSSLGTFGKAFNFAAKTLAEPEARLVFGTGLFILSKGKAGKIAGTLIAGSAVTDFNRVVTNPEVFRQNLRGQGYSENDIIFMENIKKGKAIGGSASLLAVSAMSEVLGEEILGMTSTYKPIVSQSTVAETNLPKIFGIIPRIPTSPAYRAAYKQTFASEVIAGAFEGKITMDINAQMEDREAKWWEQGLGIGLGAFSARVTGGTVAALTTVRKPLIKPSIRENVLMGGVYATDTFEYAGDVLGKRIIDSLESSVGRTTWRSFIKVGSKPGTVSMYGTTAMGIQPVKISHGVPINIPNPFPVDTRTSFYTPSQSETYVNVMAESPIQTSISKPVNVVSNVMVNTPTMISTPSNLPVNVAINIPEPVNVPANVPMNVLTSMPVTSNLPANIFTSISSFTSSPVMTNMPVTSNLPINVAINIPEPVNVPANVPINVAVNVPVVVPRWPVWPFGAGLSFGKDGKGRKKRLPAQSRYSADFIAILENIRSKKKQGMFFTGQEIRPIMV